METTIAGLARAGGVGVETVRFYQRRGLIGSPEPEPGGGARGKARRYGAQDVRRLRFIRAAQAAGFTLAEIGELLELDACEDRARAQELADRRIRTLDEKIRQLEAARDALARLVRACRHSDTGPCPIIAAFE